LAEHRLSVMTTQPNQPAQKGQDTLQGSVPPLGTPEDRRTAFGEALDYRGDVTVQTTDGRQIQGYIFDHGLDSPKPYVRLLPADGNERITVLCADITSLEFTGRDTAAGKSWETWIKKYNEKKSRGEAANIDPEPLDD